MGFLAKFEGAFYSILRIVVGGLYALHGSQKIFGFPAPAHQPFELLSWAGIGGILELACGVLIALGLGTRIAAFLASGTMAVAYFKFHWFAEGVGTAFADLKWLPPINKGEMAVLYCFIFLYIAARGPGRLSIDKT